MKKLLVIIAILIIMSSPVFAFSVKDFLMNLDLRIIGKATGLTESEGDTTSFSSDSLSSTTQFSSGESTGDSGSTSDALTDDSLSDTSLTEPPSDSSSLSPSTEDSLSQQKCIDNTPYNQCSNTKPKFCENGNLINKCEVCECPTEHECIENQCFEVEPYDPGGSVGNENDLNIAPIISPIELKTLKILESIRFEINAIDPNKNILSYYFDNQLSEVSTEIARCSISEKTITCIGIKEGEETFSLTVFDGIDESKVSFNILVLPFLPEAQKGVAAGISNTPPTADAGSDITGFPGQRIILDASKSFDPEGLLSTPETYKWYENNNLIGEGKTLEKIFELGTHNIKLVVTDSEGEMDDDTTNVIIKLKEACKNTNTMYYPEDTLCNNKWPVKEGKQITINSLTEGTCSLFEVCSDEIDFIIEDSIDCCTGELTDSSKMSACNFAKENGETLKNCQAFYLIKSLAKPIYMDSYFDGEMCCKGVTALCPRESYLYTPQPLPEHLFGVKCSNTPENNPNGYWASDSKLDLNEIALFDAPAHTSLTILKTGTCVDYSVAITTLLRKIGFSVEDIMTVEAADHAYNVFRPDLYKKFIIFDMTGNNNGLNLGGVPKGGYEYCKNIKFCYNDLGQVTCPDNEDIIGCGGISRNIGGEVTNVGFKVTNIFTDLWNKILAEIKR